MQCKNCGTNNFDVAVTCARCHAPLKNRSNETPHPVYRSTPDPEPPTQISGVGLENVRFGPAPTTEKKQPKKIQRPRQRIESAPTIQTSERKKAPVVLQEQETDHEGESSVVLFGVFALSLGISFIMLCVDFYSFFLQLQNR